MSTLIGIIVASIVVWALYLASGDRSRCSECGVGAEGPDLAGNQGHMFTCSKHPDYVPRIFAVTDLRTGIRLVLPHRRTHHQRSLVRSWTRLVHDIPRLNIPGDMAHRVANLTQKRLNRNW